MAEITMPRLSDSMQEGTVLTWLIADGEHVARGQDLVEIETDKATITHAADAEGTLRILVPEGTTLPVGAPIANVGPAVNGASGSAAPGIVSPPRASQAAAAGEPRGGAARVGAVVAENGGPGSDVAVRATPLARRVARLHAVPLAGLTGSGPRGRITRADVMRAAAVPIPEPSRRPSAAAATPSAAAKGPARRVELSRVQALVARRMAEAKATIPHFQVQTEVVMDAAVGLRAGLKAAANGEGAPSLNDLVVKACAIALRRHPRANGSYADGGFVLHERVNVGVAVAADDALVVPVVKDADTLSLGAIARETRRLAERVRAGEVTPPELSGATFTVSNLGMYGMTAIAPVINPPQAAILGVGALRDTLARVDGEIVDRMLMTLTLSCDHRILYGADAARLLADVRLLLEAPLGLAL
jgi:pyruvate dehydrogenase E2 component (dihydrolipoyllysine-residue acetyltransferase)